MSDSNPSIADRIASIREELPPEVTLVAVSKTKPNASIQDAMEADQLDFGENRVQEAEGKWPEFQKTFPECRLKKQQVDTYDITVESATNCFKNIHAFTP